MLVYDDIDACVPVAQELSERGVKLEAKVGPLGLLCSELAVAVASCASISSLQDEDYQSQIPMIVSILNETSASVARTEHGAMFDTSSHDIKVEDFANMVSQGVLATVARARSVVIPLISRLESAIGKKMEEYEDRSIANITIDEVGVDNVLDNEEVFNYFSDYKDIRKVPIREVNAFPPLNDVQLAGLVEAGSPEINDYLTEQLVTTTATGTLGQYIYSFLYMGDRLGHGEVEIFELRNMIKTIYGDCCALEGLMLAYYFGKGLVVNLPDGVNASITELEHRMTSLTSLIGSMIYGELKSHRDSLREKVLLPVGLPYVDRQSGRVNNHTSIRVNKEVYAQFLADGGSPETLFGSMVSDRKDDMQQLIDGREKYQEAYSRFVALNRSYTTSTRSQLYIDAIRDEMYAAFDDTEELKLIDKSSGVFVRLSNNLKRLGADHIATPESTYAFLRTLVCNVVFPDSPDIEKVIADIDNFECQAGEENLSPSEVACFVLIDLIVDWLCEQVVVRGA